MNRGEHGLQILHDLVVMKMCEIITTAIEEQGIIGAPEQQYTVQTAGPARMLMERLNQAITMARTEIGSTR